MRYNVLNQMTAKNLDAGKYADGQGLWLVKREKQFGKWVFRFALYGKRKEMGLGPWPDVSISEARTSAAEARKLLRAGHNPIQTRLKEKRRQAPLTVNEAVQGCFDVP